MWQREVNYEGIEDPLLFLQNGQLTGLMETLLFLCIDADWH